MSRRYFIWRPGLIAFLGSQHIELNDEQDAFGVKLEEAYEAIAPAYVDMKMPPLCIDNVILSPHLFGEFNIHGQCLVLNAALFHPDCLEIFKGVWVHELCHGIANKAGHPGHSELHAELCRAFAGYLGVAVDANAMSDDAVYSEIDMFRARMWAAKFAAKNCPRYLWVDTDNGDLADFCLLTEGQHRKASATQTYTDPYLNKHFVFGCKVQYHNFKKHLNMKRNKDG